MAPAPTNPGGSRRGWRANAPAQASPAARWTARVALSLLAAGAIGLFLWLVSRSSPIARTQLVVQTVDDERTHHELPPASMYWTSKEAAGFDDRRVAVDYSNPPLGTALPRPPTPNDPLIVCYAGQGWSPPGSGACELLEPASQGRFDLGKAIREIAALDSPLKLVVIDTGCLTADPDQGLALNAIAPHLVESVRQSNDERLFVLVSGGVGEVSWMPSALGRSAFCESLVRGLRGEADQADDLGGDRNDRVDLAELACFTCWRTWAWSQRHAPAAQRPLLLRGGVGVVDPKTLLEESKLREVTLSRVGPKEEPAAEAPPEKNEPAATAPPAPPAPPAKTAGRRRAAMTNVAWVQASQSAPPSDPPPAAPLAPQPPTAEATDEKPAATGDPKPGAARDAAPEPPPKKPPETTEEFFAELWRLRDALEQAPEAGASPVDYAPHAWRVFQKSLADQQLRYRLDSARSGGSRSTQLEEELARWLADLLALQPGAAPPASSAGVPRQDHPISAALSQLREAKARQAAEWLEYREATAAPPEYLAALRSLQQALVRLPSYRELAAANLDDDAVCDRVAKLQEAARRACDLLKAESLDAAGVESFRLAVKPLADDRLAREQVAEALKADPLGRRLMRIETLLATPLPTAEERDQLLEAVSALSKSLDSVAPSREVPPVRGDLSSDQWRLLRPWRRVLESEAALVLGLAGQAAPAARDDGGDPQWKEMAVLGQELAGAYRAAAAEPVSAGRMAYWISFLQPSDLENDSARVATPPWPAFFAGPIDLQLIAAPILEVTPRFGVPSRLVEYRLGVRSGGARPQRMTLRVEPTEDLEVVWKGPASDWKEWQPVARGEIELPPKAGSQELLFLVRAKRDALSQAALAISARAERDRQADTAEHRAMVRFAKPDVQVAAAGEPPPEVREGLPIACFPGENSVALDLVSQTTREPLPLSIRLLARRRDSNESPQTLATALVESLAPGARVPLPFAAPAPAAPPAAGAEAAAATPPLLDLRDQEVFCEVWETTPPPPGAPPGTAATETLLLRQGLSLNPVLPRDYVTLRPAEWSAGGDELQLRVAPLPGRFPAAGSKVAWNRLRSALPPLKGQFETKVTRQTDGLLRAEVPREPPDDLEAWRVVLDVDGFARGLVYDVPVDRTARPEPLKSPEITIDPRLIAPPGLTEEQKKAFDERAAQAIDRADKRIVISPEETLEVVAEVNSPYAHFSAEQDDVILIGFDVNDSGRLDAGEDQARWSRERDDQFLWSGVTDAGHLGISARFPDWSSGPLRIPEATSREVPLIGEVRLHRGEAAEDRWEVVVDDAPPGVDLASLGPIRATQGDKPNVTLTVDDPQPGSGVASVEIGIYREGMPSVDYKPAVRDPEQPRRWTAVLEIGPEAVPGDYQLRVRAQDRVGNRLERLEIDRAVRVSRPAPPEPEMAKTGDLIVTLRLGSRAPREGKARLLKDGQEIARNANEQGVAVFEGLALGDYTLEASGRHPGGQVYKMSAPVAVTIRASQTPQRMTANLTDADFGGETDP